MNFPHRRLLPTQERFDDDTDPELKAAADNAQFHAATAFLPISSNAGCWLQGEFDQPPRRPDQEILHRPIPTHQGNVESRPLFFCNLF